MNQTIRIVVNGFPETVPENATVADLLEHFQEGDKDLIVERNGRFVFAQTYASTTVAEGDRLEFINPDFGG